MQKIVEFVRDAFSVARLSGDKREYNLPCPFHTDNRTKKHLYLNAKTGKWICFKCGEQGGFSRLVRHVLELDENAHLNFSDYVIFEGEGAASSLLSLRPAAPEKPKPERVLPHGYLPVWTPTAEHENVRAEALAYLARRGVSLMTARSYEIGFAPAGLLSRRVIVPVRSMEGALVGWVARDITGMQAIKILSSPSTSGAVKDHVAFLDKARGFTHLVVVEGPFDALRHGPQYVALLGKQATEQQVAHLIRAAHRGVERITVLLDRDAPLAAKTLAHRLVLHVAEVRLGTLTKSPDPGEAMDEEIAEVVETARPVRT